MAELTEAQKKHNEELHRQNTRSFVAMVYSFLGVHAEEEHKKSRQEKHLPGLALGRELSQEEKQTLPPDLQELIALHGGHVKCHWVVPTK